jgi:hypothetical protein
MLKPTLAFLAALAALPPAGWAHTFESNDRWASFGMGKYTISNDVWGEHPAPETLWADSDGIWGVTTAQDGDGIKSYPHGDFGNLDSPVAGLGRLQTSFSAVSPAGCAYDQAYDLWLNGSQYEVMIWNRWEHTNPIARSYNHDGTPNATYRNVTLGGITYDVYTGTGGSGACMSFLRRNQVDSGTIDLAALLKWISTTGWYANPRLTSIQNGWEIISTGGVRRDFTMRGFSVTQ